MTAVMLAAALAVTARAQPPAATVSYARGPVTATAAGRARLVKTGAAVDDGATVAAGPGATAVLALPDGSRLKLREETTLTLQLAPDAGGLTGAFLSLGGVFADVAHGVSPHFAIRTPHAVAAVRGTEFFTAYGRPGRTGRDLWVCVGRGAVAVSADTSPEPLLVRAGEGVLLPGGRRTTAPQRYQWTETLNWNMDPSRGPVVDDTKLDGAYTDLKDQDYR